MAVFGFNDKTIAEELRDKVMASRSSMPAGMSMIDPDRRIGTVMGFYTQSSIGGATIDGADPTQSRYYGGLCDVFSLTWNATGFFEPTPRFKADGTRVSAIVLNATSTAIGPGEMVWGLACVGSMNGVPVFMAVMGDCS